VQTRWSLLLQHLDTEADEQVVSELSSVYGDLFVNKEAMDSPYTFFELLQKRILRVSYRSEIEKPLKDLFRGLNLSNVYEHLDQIHADLRSSRLFVATHMHAGDGNVHTNIPVHSNDYEMLHTAEKIVEEIMALAESLGGVISGEHGIGYSQKKYMSML